MRVLLTGAAGFIGSRISSALTARGHEVIAVDAMLPAAHREGSAPPDGCALVDIRDGDALAALLPGVDVVCHQAAVVGAGVNALDAPSYALHNDAGTATLLAEMYRTGMQRLVLASSMVVYGQGAYTCATHGAVDPAPRTRTTRFSPNSEMVRASISRRPGSLSRSLPSRVTTSKRTSRCACS